MSTIIQLSLLAEVSDKVIAPKRSQTLLSVLRYLNNIPHINHGGCGLSALAIYRWCKKNGIEVSASPFVLLCADDYELARNNTALENGNIDEVYIPHLVIEIDDLLWDSSGNQLHHTKDSGFKMFPFRCEYPLDEADLLILLNDDRWNNLFNRRKYKNAIARRLQIDLSDVVLF